MLANKSIKSMGNALRLAVTVTISCARRVEHTFEQSSAASMRRTKDMGPS